MFARHAVRLPLLFDPERLQAELHAIQPEEWISHYNNKEYEGDWAVAPLRSVAGHPSVIYAVSGARLDGFYRNTPLLERCPYLKEVLSGFQCPVGAARLMRLGAGARILEHADDMGAAEYEEFRLHIPVQTNEAVSFWVDHKLVPMKPGELWYADFSLRHSVENNGSADRIHLVLDCVCNEWLGGMIRHSSEIEAIVSFLQKIGIQVASEKLEEDTFLPGLLIRNGGIVYDPEKLKYPGDMLHEAGHIAVAEETEQLTGNVAKGDNRVEMGLEIGAILWSYAASKAIGLPEDTVFHPHGYRGQSEWYIENFRQGNYIGLPLLEWMGMTCGPEKAAAKGVAPFPEMQHWRRQPAPVETV